MTVSHGPKVVLAVLCLLVGSQAAFAQPLSYWLGAYKLDGLRTYADCQNKARGMRETLMADRLDKKLAISTALTADERKVWQDDIDALRAVVAKHIAYKAPDPKKPDQYLEGFTTDEFRAIQSMSTRFSQEVNLTCEQLYGDIARKKTGETTESQARYEAGLRAKMVQPVDVDTLPLQALPSPFPKPQVSEEQKLGTTVAQSKAAMAQSQAAVARIGGCTAQMAGLRWKMMADKMQEHLAGGAGLTAQQRTDLEADIRAVRAAADQGAAQPAAVDAANPYRFMTWLTNDEQTKIGADYAAQMPSLMAQCTKN
jgi:hypothetical protein